LRALNGKEAVDICKKNIIDLVLMDIKMPVMDGFEATGLIKKFKPDLKIIAQTAFISDRSYAISCGCTDFIAKPFRKKQLVSLINSYL
jgi:CheY-like chemotaxis protein